MFAFEMDARFFRYIQPILLVWAGYTEKPFT